MTEEMLSDAQVSVGPPTMNDASVMMSWCRARSTARALTEPLRLRALSNGVGVAVVSLLAQVALLGFAMLMRFPREAEVARAYWVAYPAAGVAGLTIGLAGARRMRRRVEAMRRDLSRHDTHAAARSLLWGEGGERGGYYGLAGALGYAVSLVVSAALNRGVTFWLVTIVFCAILPYLGVHASARAWHLTRALGSQDVPIE